MSSPIRFDRRQAIRGIVGGCLVGLDGLFQGGTVWGQDASDSDRPLPPVPSVLPRGTAEGREFAAATVHPLATQAAIKAFERGGNAFDAAVAAAFMLGVVDGHNSGIGGGCFILARSATGRLIAIDGRETAPSRAHRDLFIRNGQPDPLASQFGPLASGVPGQVAALANLSLKHGRGDWSAGLSHAAAVADRGFELGPNVAAAIRRKASRLAKFPASASIYLDADGEPLLAGQIFRQPDLAKTLAALAVEGPDWFYRGPFAERCDRWMAENAGLLNRGDFASYTAKSREPLVTPYRGWQVVGFPPPSSGGIHVAQMLMMLEAFPIGQLYREAPDTAVHLLAEVMKRAFADRAHWLGDADFAPVPKGLIDRAYCQQLAANIDLQRASPVRSHGMPPRAGDDLFSDRHTTHLATADAAGNWVAITNTINTSFGSCVVIPGTGVVLNNEMDDFSIAPGTPNAFGLIGAEANSVQPGKRPLSSMSPTIVLDAAGNPRLSCGAAGGPRIISATLQCVVRMLDTGATVGEALAAPRVHHQWSPDELLLEAEWDAAIVQALQARGHELAEPGDVAIAQAIERTPDGLLRAAADRRADGSAAAE